MVYATDLKSVGLYDREGSSPFSATMVDVKFLYISVYIKIKNRNENRYFRKKR